MSVTTPFSKRDLIPQEERLFIQKSQTELLIGIPKEQLSKDKRICITPEAVQTLVNHGHSVLLESQAGIGANYSDFEYSKAGAQITQDSKKVLACPTLVMVTPPTLEQIKHIAPNTTIWSSIQLKTLDISYFQALAKKKISAIAIDFIQDNHGTYIASSSLSEIAGVSSVLIASELMTTTNNGKGLLFGNITGVFPTEVVILGAGIVAEFAAKTALGLGANVKVFDNSLQRLRRLQNNLPSLITTSTIHDKLLLKALMRCDVAIGAIRGTNRSPIVVNKTMVENMKQGSVIIDVSIDNGGCFETSELTTHENPVVIKNGVIHYGVPNITSRYSKTASQAMSNILTPLLIEYAQNGEIQGALHASSPIKTGIYCYKGLITNQSVAKWFDLEYKDLLLFSF